MKETEKPATRKVILCGGSGEGRAVSRATRRGWQADPCEKTHDTVGTGRFLERKEDKIRRQIVYKILFKNFYIILIKMIDFLVLVGYIIGRCDCEKATTIDRRTHRSWIWN
ncbi:MAG: hypothetical protein ACLVJV_06805 [Oscillospiraceae bacterium]